MALEITGHKIRHLDDGYYDKQYYYTITCNVCDKLITKGMVTSANVQTMRYTYNETYCEDHMT